jgi:arsenate reductase
VNFTVVEYLNNPLEQSDLERFLDLLPDPPGELVRKDKHFKELGLREDDYQTRETVVALLLEHPKLMQRPVIIRGERAVIARPSEKVLEIL